MTIEIFAQLTTEGDLKQKGDHVFAGTIAEMVAVANTLDQAFALNRRQKAIPPLAAKFRAGHPPVRLTHKECQLLESTVSQFGDGGAHKQPKTTTARKVADLFSDSLCVW